MDEQKLNRKLAEWAGFSIEQGTGMVWSPGKSKGFCEADMPFLPSFTQSLDACFKWLVPKLFTWSIGKNWELGTDPNMTITPNGIKVSVDLVRPEPYDQVLPLEAIANTPALALCRAIEKLIDREKA